MAEIRRGGAEGGDGGSRGGGPAGGAARPAFGDRLPWLEPVDDEDEEDYRAEPGGYGGVIVTAVAVLALIALATAAILWFRHHRAATADIGQIIHADPGPYKQKPQDPGGMKPDMSEQVAARTGAGQDVDAPLDAAAMPETAMVTPHAQPAHGPAPGAPSPSATTAAPATGAAAPTTATASRATASSAAGARTPSAQTAPRPVASAAAPPPAPRQATPVVKPSAAPDAPAGPGGAIQLGAFSSEAKARAAWKGLSTRFDFLHDMTPAYGAVATGTGTLYRLRASGGSGGSPASLCSRLKLAGESCAVIGG